MKIYVTHASNFDYQNELYLPLRKSKLNSLHEIALPHENSTNQFNSKEYMKDCNVILAEVSFPSTGQGIELGWANMYKKPIICLYKKGVKPSGALKVVSDTFIEYESSEDMVQSINTFFSSFQSHL